MQKENNNRNRKKKPHVWMNMQQLLSDKLHTNLKIKIEKKWKIKETLHKEA